MMVYGGVDLLIHNFLTSALDGGEWSASRFCHFTLEERASITHWTRCGEDPTAGLDEMEKLKFLTLSGLEIRTLGHATLSQSLYQLTYCGSYTPQETTKNYK
jgi:hypothetical protein